MPTTPTAIPDFAPVESDEDEDDSICRKDPPVGALEAPVSEARSSVLGAVSDTKNEKSDGRDPIEGAKVGTTGTDLEIEANSLVVFGTDIVGFIAMPIKLVAKPGTATIELTAIIQSVCQYITACVISRDEHRFSRHGVISVMRELDLGHWQ